MISPLLLVALLAISTANAGCPNNGAMTDKARDAVLKLHNMFRSSLARGLEKDKLGAPVPKAAHMLKMVYDCDIENSAVKHAQQCIFEHSQTPDVGENLYATSALDVDVTEAVKNAAQSWWSELKLYGYGSENTLTEEIFYRPDSTGHYTQMAWDTTYKLGCAVQYCNDMTMVVCQNGPA
ncbi:SCP-like protein [Oesophagostomum dentatum]|uniref:SCP-like protein n=1 Tax=Oesophagostomum dentatum TaxID=61180 RepID=A0A0B1T5I6_OESDE|nr:SCP-like protein [Oesophagostomum dentatum]